MVKSVGKQKLSSSKSSHKSSSWRKYQNTSVSHKRMKWAVAFLLGVAAFVLFGKILSGIALLGQPQTKEYTSFTTKNYTWGGTSTINLVVNTDQVYAVSFNPENEEVTILKIPGDTYLETARNFGKWPTRSIYQLGQAEKTPIGAQLLKETVEATLGVPIDGYLSFQGSLQNSSLDEVVKGLRKNPFEVISFIRQSQSDLSTWELYKLVWGLRNVRADKVADVDLGQSLITTSLLMPDGSRALGIDQTRLDQLIQKEFEDTHLSYQGLSVALYNATEKSGLAEKASRVILNMGGRVTLTSTSKQKYAESRIVGNESYSKTRLAQVFAPHCLSKGSFLSKKPCQEALGDDIETNRADIIIILGEDYLKRHGL